MLYEFIDKRIKNSIVRCVKKNKCEKALSLIAFIADVYYKRNQSYRDVFLEKNLSKIKQRLLGDIAYADQARRENCVLFYDAFGHDTRGLALIYVINILKLGYEVIYVTSSHARNNQRIFKKNTKGYKIKFLYIDMDTTYIEHINKLRCIFEKYAPQYAFFYSYPYDVAGLVVFEYYRHLVNTFLINLTDHAFWLGTRSFNKYIEFREYGANISSQYRKIPNNKIVLLPYYPYIDKNIKFEGFPFESDGKQILFSGGTLYKTIGDNNKYYKIVTNVLEENKNLIFLYAGIGNDVELKKIISNFPERVYHIPERKDLYQLMRNVTLYLNTYPIIGGLMTQYAVVAGKIPLTLKFDDCAEGLLINQNSIGVEYYSEELLVEDINRLLKDDNYRNERELLIRDSVISEDSFRFELKSIIDNHNSSFDWHFKKVINSDFKKIYLDRFDLIKVLSSYITKRDRRICKYIRIIIAKFMPNILNKFD